MTDSDGEDVRIIVAGAQLAPGQTSDHTFGARGAESIARSLDGVADDWRRIVEQMQELVRIGRQHAGDLELEEITFQVGFDAKGRLAFIAEAGVSASITVKFRPAGA